MFIGHIIIICFVVYAVDSEYVIVSIYIIQNLNIIDDSVWTSTYEYGKY